MTIGQKIREIRLEKGMTLDQVANLCEISKQRLQAIESAKGYPQIQTVIRISKALHRPLRDFLNEPLELGFEECTSYKTSCANAGECPFFKKVGANDDEF